MADKFLERNDGSKFYLDAPLAEMAQMFTPEVTAHSLSLMCRYNGHTKRFYSVAEHTLIMAENIWAQDWSTAQDALQALHHDDAEEIIGDMISPVKTHDQFFKTIEAKLDEAIAMQYRLPFVFPEWLKMADARIVKDERANVMQPSKNKWGVDTLTPLGVRFMPIVGRIPWLMKRRWVDFHYFLEEERVKEELDVFTSAYNFRG
jgi:hypothetical protein